MAARSAPDAITVLQEWAARQYEMMTENTKQLLEGTQKFMQTGANIFVNSGKSNGPAVSS